MQLRDGTGSHPRTMYGTIVEFGAAQGVSTLQTILGFTDYGSDFQKLAVHAENQDLTNTLTLIVDVSHGGVRPNLSMRQQITIQPGQEGVVTIDSPNPFTYIRVQFQTASPGFPTVQFRWALLGMRR